MPQMHLTEIAVRALKPPEKQITFFDKVLPAFGCRVTPNGTKSWVVMHGRQRKLTTLGRYPEISLSEARTSAKRVLSGHSDAPQPTDTFSEVLTSFLAHCDYKNRPRTAKDYKRLLERHFKPTLGPKALNTITSHDITKIIDKRNRSHPPAFHAAAIAGIKGSVRLARAAATREQA